MNPQENNMPNKRILLAIAITLVIASIALFLKGAEPAAAASLLVVGLTFFIMALSGDHKRRRP
jgi:uncharacterized membrane protein